MGAPRRCHGEIRLLHALLQSQWKPKPYPSSGIGLTPRIYYRLEQCCNWVRVTPCHGCICSVNGPDLSRHHGGDSFKLPHLGASENVAFNVRVVRKQCAGNRKTSETRITSEPMTLSQSQGQMERCGSPFLHYNHT